MLINLKALREVINIEEIFITEDAIPKRETLKWINIIVTKKGLNF